jgi:hypothetical protein
MSQSTPPSYSRAQAYAAIEAEMMQSEKGRGFLRDYLRRNRSAETEALLDAIAKLQQSLSDETGERRLETLREELTDVQRNMARSRRALAEIVPAYASGAKPAIPHTGQSVADAREPSALITEASLAIAMASGMLRATGAQERLCGQIERQIDSIRDACEVIRANRDRQKLLEAAFQDVEAEIMAILDVWDFDAAPKAEEQHPPAIDKALNGLAEELSLAMLTDAQKAALFH